MTATSLLADMAMFLAQPELALMRAFANLGRVSIIAPRLTKPTMKGTFQIAQAVPSEYSAVLRTPR